ncbi:MAG TPA: glycosyltransferase family 9 protein [Gemmatimonadaceae bacterium]|nr:glycosyltransferase family 9 protein [Gemmatimonadaceae bacterium]
MTTSRVKRTLKQLERSWKRLVFRALGVLLPGQRAHSPDWSARRYRVLYLRYDRIGDMIMATPLIRAIARSHRTIELDVLASPPNAIVLAGNPHVRRVLTFDRKRFASFVRTARALRRSRYDAVIDGMVLQPSLTMLLLMLATGARYRIGIGGRANDFIYTLPVAPAPPDAHQIMQSAATAAPFAVDVSGTSWRPELFIGDDERARAEQTWRNADGGLRLLVNIAAGEPRRRWPADRVIAVVRAARKANPSSEVLVMAPPAELSEAERIARDSGAVAVVPGLRDALALVATADVVFSPDTSIAHAASAFNKPSVVMLVGGSGIFEPFDTPGRFLYSPGPTLESLPADPVIDALLSVMAESAAHPARGGSPRR